MVSIIILTYNRALLLSQTLYSILNQSYTDFEIIILNDGSTDKTSEIIKNFDDKRIKLYNLKKQNNLAKLRNKGIKYSAGEFIAFCDDDDLWESNKLEIQLNYLKKYHFICSNAKLIDIDNSIIEKQYIKFSSSVVLRTEMLLKANTILPSSVVFNKNILTTDEPFDEDNFKNLCEDYNLWIKLSLKNKLFFLNEQLISHRTHNSWARTFNHAREIMNNHIKLIKPYTKSKQKALKNAAYQGIINNKVYNLKYFYTTKKYTYFLGEFLKFIYLFKNPYYIITFYKKTKKFISKRLKSALSFSQ